jgi:O-antigen/teichoic acid export membrane protein
MALGFVFVFFAYALRLGAGMAVFVLIARYLGPNDFGVFSYWLSIATIFCILVNFGFGTMVLKSFGDSHHNAHDMMSKVLTAKLLLTCMVVMLSLISILFIEEELSRKCLLILLSAQLFESFSEHYNLGFRVNNHFKHEATLSTATSTIHIIVLVSTLFLTRSLVAVCVAFSVSRLIGLMLTTAYVSRVWQPLHLGKVKHALSIIKSSWAYALEIKLYTLYTQLDSIIIFNVLGASTLGLYQAGMKLVLGACRLAPILAQLILPKMSKAYLGSPTDAKATFLRSFAVFFLLGMAGMLVMSLFSAQLTNILFGNKYINLSYWLPCFGVILLLRFIETGTGLILVAKNLQTKKVIFVLLQVVVMVVGGYYAINNWGLVGWLSTNIIALLVVIISYLFLMKKCYANLNVKSLNT